MTDPDDDDPYDDGPDDAEVATIVFMIFAMVIAFLIFAIRPMATWPAPHPIRVLLEAHASRAW